MINMRDQGGEPSEITPFTGKWGGLVCNREETVEAEIYVDESTLANIISTEVWALEQEVGRLRGVIPEPTGGRQGPPPSCGG